MIPSLPQSISLLQQISSTGFLFSHLVTLLLCSPCSPKPLYIIVASDLHVVILLLILEMN